ncbi:DUF2771 family protein [Prauserella muralis]|uniref:Uncharacterized protein n=1 Tax=Prauserella muralis TaxID=588067 RepID=A0A2V4B773_9PSEU|nr:DUF2771 family protein [Prauserella muralis]PXY30971.1 hypothetical protein BAY60_00635 [Prauserella muralis]TWE14767.1 uncharacterized protein DUF2771 [Prauserella muralis]
MRARVGALLACGALALAGCSAPGPPEVTFFADGDSIRADPLIYCDALLESCERGGKPASLKVRPGKPVQVSLPSDVSETPWALNVQYLDAQGRPQPVRQQVFTDGTQHAYTVTPGSPRDQLVVVEIQQLGAAYAADSRGNPILDENGQPQLVVRGVWSLRIDYAS